MYWTLFGMAAVCCLLFLLTGKEVMGIATHIYIAAALISISGK